MKLPENKKERTQILVLVGISSVMVLYAGWQFGVGPLLKKRQEKLNLLQDYAKEREEAQKADNARPHFHKRNADTIKEIQQIVEDYLLHPDLAGRYALVAKDFINAWADAVDLPKPEVAETLGTQLPPGKKHENALAPFALRISITAPYETVIALVREIQTKNPYICISNLEIAAQPDPENHAAAFIVEWPRWSDRSRETDLPKQLADQVKAAEEPTKGGADES